MLNEDVIYLIMPARFGGINGIRERLPYLADLGVTALWLTPVFKSSSYHGYDITDYYDVDPRYGTIEDYKALVREAHSYGLKIILDIVLNHCGIEHPWCTDPKYKDFFNTLPAKVAGGPNSSLFTLNSSLTNYRLTTVVDPYASDYDRRQTIEGAFTRKMPDLDIRNPKLLKYFTDCTQWWIEYTHIDGIRIDTFPYADREAMEKYLNTLHTRYPDLHIIGETWVTDTPFIASMQQGELDSPMDFALFSAFGYAKHEETNEVWSGLNRIYNTLCYDYLYKKPAKVMAFLDNHDVNRFIEDYYPDTEKADSMLKSLKQSLAILLTLPRIPQIYYGTEVLMGGTTEKSDSNVRKPFPKRCLTAEGRTPDENDMHRYVRRLLQWRKANSRLIAYGTMKQFIPYKGIYVYERRLDGASCLVIANGNNRVATLHPERYAEVIDPATSGTDIISGRTVSLTKPLRLSPRKTMIISHSTAPATAQD